MSEWVGCIEVMVTSASQQAHRSGEDAQFEYVSELLRRCWKEASQAKRGLFTSSTIDGSPGQK